MPPALIAPAVAEACPAAMRARLLSAPGPGDDAVRLTCSVTLGPGDQVRRRVILEGREASGVTLDCNGATIGQADPPPAFAAFAIEVRSAPAADGSARWERPEDVTIRGCTILGHVRVWGMGQSGQGAAVRASSHSLGHTERAQAAAPARVSLLSSRITALGYTPVYLAPGVTGFTLADSTLTGRAASVAVYLDAESAGNAILRNRFDIETGREVIAVDGSARNRIADNAFTLHGEGAIRLYRNCGEGGTVRHQTPSSNTIRGNVFRQAGFLAPEPVVVNSRGGWRLYCGADAGYPFGSSLDNGDNGVGNVIEDNRTE
ncbi:right-handed parallel beta-helix repeat-containing protein [Methylobacterium sp. A54F]